jgi:hypothetical protein
MKHVKRCVPVLAFNRLNECLQTDIPLFKFEKEVFYFVLDLFYRLPAFNKQIQYTDTGLIRISSKYFGKYVTKGYAKYLNYLIKHKIIECDKIKKVGKSYGYRMMPEFDSKILRIKIPSTTNIAKRIIENYNKRKKYHKKLPEHIKEMKSHFKKQMKINLEEALGWLERELSQKNISLNQYNVLLLSVYAIDDQELFFNVNNTNGRIDSNLTNLKSELRQFIIGDYHHIDCQNSQPLIVNFITEYINENSNKQFQEQETHNITTPSLGDDKEKILQKELNNSDLEYLKFFPKMSKKALEEFGQFRDDTFNQDFYCAIQSKYEVLYGKQILRSDVKEIIYKVFFSRNRSFPNEKKIFRELYPTIYSVIHKLKKQRHNKFALCLQRIESEIFIQRIAKRLVESGIIPLTIHDSIVVLAPDKELALQIMKEEYVAFLKQSPKFICTEF